MLLVIVLYTFVRALFRGSAAVALENVALRHQLTVLQRSVKRPRLSRWDRILWLWLSRLWADWRSGLVIVRPGTVLAWHRRGFSSTGVGSHGQLQWVVRRSTSRSEI
jgi:putative transposase